MKAIECILLDMDGVIADFIGGCVELFCTDRSLFDTVMAADKLGITEDAFWNRIEAKGPAFWDNLQEYSWTRELVDMCQAIAPTFITTCPGRLIEAQWGKLTWLKRKFPKIIDEEMYYMCKYKEKLATPRRLLIDDMDKNCDAFKTAGGIALLFPQPWNTKKTPSFTTFKQDFNELLEVLQKLPQNQE